MTMDPGRDGEVSADAQHIADTAQEIKEELIVNMREARQEEWKRWRKRRLSDAVLIAIAAYTAIWFHSAFLSNCIQTSELGPTEAAICRYVFWPWHSDIQPGPQYSNRIPAPDPSPSSTTFPPGSGPRVPDPYSGH